MTTDKKDSPYNDLPWSLSEPGKWNEISVVAPSGKLIAYLRKQTAFETDDADRMNGQFIIRAVNSHDALVEALLLVSSKPDNDMEWSPVVKAALNLAGVPYEE